MTPVVFAFCPATPLLAPEVSVSADGLHALRTAAGEAVTAIVAAAPDEVLVIGAAPRAAGYEGTYDWSGFGVRVSGPGGEPLPHALGVGAFLLDQAGWSGPRRFLGVPAATAPDACADLGQELSGGDRAAVLVIGDGSARRTLKAPGYLDPRAEAFDAVVAAALGDADLDGIAGLDPDLAEHLMVSGRPAWQVAAAAARSASWRPELLLDAAPYGVAWLIATWDLPPTS